MSDVGFYLLLDRVHIQAANAVSSPLTYGFPALSGFMGAVHALSRQLAAGFTHGHISLEGVLVACHSYDIKRFRPHDSADYTLNQSRNPIKKTGQTASIIEEGKIDLTVSLLVEVCCDENSFYWLEDNKEKFEQHVVEKLYQQRVAAGSVHKISKVSLFNATTSAEILKASLLPAFVLMDASKDLVSITQDLQQQNEQATALDALLEISTLHHEPTLKQKEAEEDHEKNLKNDKAKAKNKDKEKEKKYEWKTRSVKTGRGWLVPMPLGFQGIAPMMDAGQLKNCRTTEYPSQYVECLYGLGKWVFPHSIESIEQAFWRYQTVEEDLFLIKQSTTEGEECE